MNLANLHTHTKYCDGNNTAEEMILSAINYKMQSIGISTHGPANFNTDWNINSAKINTYIDEINNLKIKFKNIIKIYLGMEMEYFPTIGFNEISKEIFGSLDYYIGSVHYLGTFNDGTMWTVDYNLNELLKGIEESFKGDKRLAVETYYSLISEMAIKYEPPIIGHLDLFKKNNKDNILFNEKDEWYIKTVEDCLNVIKNTKSIVEINTGGIARGYIKEQYPSTWIINMIKDKTIPIIINSDAHNSKDLLCSFDEMYKLVSYMKFDKLSYLTEKGWKQQKIQLN